MSERPLGYDRTNTCEINVLDIEGLRRSGHAGRGLVITLWRLSQEVPPERSPEYDAFVDGLNQIALQELQAWKTAQRAKDTFGTRPVPRHLQLVTRRTPTV